MFTKKLSLIEVKNGIIRIAATFRDKFPARGEVVTLIDNSGIEFVSHMHNQVGRIDGLTTMHQLNHAHEGTVITVSAVDGRPNTYSVNYQS